MSRTLSPETLEATLDAGRAALPIVRNAVALDSLLLNIRSGQTQGSLEGLESRWARARLDYNRLLLSADAQVLLDSANLYVIPHMYHGARATTLEGRRTLVIFRGVLDAIMYYATVNQFIVAVPGELDEIIPFPSLPAVGVRTAIAVALPTFLVHFARDMMAPADLRPPDEETAGGGDQRGRRGT